MMGRSWKMSLIPKERAIKVSFLLSLTQDVAEIVISEDDESDFPIEVPEAAPKPRSVQTQCQN